MSRKTWLISLIVLIMLLALGGSVVAAQTNGAIRGVVYEDVDANGICGATTDPILVGVPIEFVTASGAVITLTSGDDGSYGLVAAGHGTWNVTAKPGDGFRVTSEQTKTVVVTAEEPEVNGVNFCVARVTTTSGGGGTVVLPESGSGLAPSMIVATVFGLALIAAGVGLLLLQRRAA